MRDTGIYRQGDVLLVRVGGDMRDIRTLLKGMQLREVPDNGARIVLALGEATGHAHAVQLLPVITHAGVQPGMEVAAPGKKTAVLWDSGAERFLQVLQKTTLRHEEHAAIDLEPAVYRVVRQREYDPEVQRRYVED